MALPVKPYLQHVSLHPEAGFDLDAWALDLARRDTQVVDLRE